MNTERLKFKGLLLVVNFLMASTAGFAKSSFQIPAKAKDFVTQAETQKTADTSIFFKKQVALIPTTFNLQAVGFGTAPDRYQASQKIQTPYPVLIEAKKGDYEAELWAGRQVSMTANVLGGADDLNGHRQIKLNAPSFDQKLELDGNANIKQNGKTICWVQFKAPFDVDAPFDSVLSGTPDGVRVEVRAHTNIHFMVRKHVQGKTVTCEASWIEDNSHKGAVPFEPYDPPRR